MCGECREDAEAEIERLAGDYGAKYAKAVESLRWYQDCLLSFLALQGFVWNVSESG